MTGETRGDVADGFTFTAAQVRQLSSRQREPGSERFDFAALKSRAISAVEHWRTVANESGVRRKLDAPEVPEIDVRFDIDSTRVAGLAWAHRFLVQLHPDLLQFYPTSAIGQTVPHEVAHIVSRHWFDRYRGKRIQPHGREWQRIMSLFGKPPEVFHTHHLMPRFNTAVYPVKCGCKELVWVPKSSLKGLSKRVCHQCRQHRRQAYTHEVEPLIASLQVRADSAVEIDVQCLRCKHVDTMQIIPSEAVEHPNKPCSLDECAGVMYRKSI